MSLKTDIDNIKNLEQGITNNKVSKFAYTDTAYTNNDVNGVQTYNINNEQNIPVADADVLQVNTTITNKGYRAQASSLTRMLVNHFFGRVSYNLNKINDFFLSFLTSFSSYLGQPNGVATLDENGRIPFSQLPESAVEYKGEWDASTNTPTLVDGTGTNGSMYYVSVGGTQNLGSGSITFLEGDRIIYNGEDEVWQRLSGGTVKKVNSVSPDSTGNVQLSFSNLDGTVANSQIANNAVTTAKIADNAVTNAKIADNAVTNAKFGDVLPISKGGTGQTKAIDVCNTLINALGKGNFVPEDDDFFISQYAGGGTTHTDYHRRPFIKLWTYIQNKISSVLGLTASTYNGKANTADTADALKNPNTYLRTSDKGTSNITPLSFSTTKACYIIYDEDLTIYKFFFDVSSPYAGGTTAFSFKLITLTARLSFLFGEVSVMGSTSYNSLPCFVALNQNLPTGSNTFNSTVTISVPNLAASKDVVCVTLYFKKT